MMSIGSLKSHQSVSSRICTLASGCEALRRTRRVQPQLPGLMGLLKLGGIPVGGGVKVCMPECNKAFILDQCDKCIKLHFVPLKWAKKRCMHHTRLQVSPLCRSAARWPSSLCHRCLFLGSPAARSDVSSCACDGVSSRPSFSVHHCLSGSHRVNCRQVGVELEMKGRGHPPPVCPLSFGLCGRRDGLTPGGAINKRFPSH